MQAVMRLVSCPFCSGEVFLQEGKNKVNSTIYWVECLECGIKSPDDFDAKRVYKYWNKPAFRQLDMLKLESDIFKAEKNGIINGLKDKIREMGKDILEDENLFHISINCGMDALMAIVEDGGGFMFDGDGNEDNCSSCENMIEIATNALKKMKY